MHAQIHPVVILCIAEPATHTNPASHNPIKPCHAHCHLPAIASGRNPEAGCASQSLVSISQKITLPTWQKRIGRGARCGDVGTNKQGCGDVGTNKQGVASPAFFNPSLLSTGPGPGRPQTPHFYWPEPPGTECAQSWSPAQSCRFSQGSGGPSTLRLRRQTHERMLRVPRRAQRTAGGTFGPRSIGASPVWAARSSYWRSRCYL